MTQVATIHIGLHLKNITVLSNNNNDLDSHTFVMLIKTIHNKASTFKQHYVYIQWRLTANILTKTEAITILTRPRYGKQRETLY